MGCWEETCLVSHLPIERDEPANLILLARTELFGGPQGDAGWQPYSLPMLGKYDEYGCVEVTDDWRSRLTLEVLRADLIDTDGPRDREGMCRADLDRPEALMYLQDRIRDGHVQVRDPVARERVAKLGFCLVREDVRQALLGFQFDDWRGKLDFKMHLAMQIKDRARAREVVDAMLAKASHDLESAKKTPNEILTEDVLLMAERPPRPSMTAEEIQAEGQRLVEECRRLQVEWGGRLGNLRGYRLFATHANTDDEIRDAAEFSHLCGCFALLRRQWLPQGWGSQDSSWDVHRAFAAVVASICTAKIASEARSA